MKKLQTTMLGMAIASAALAQNGVSGPMGLYGPAYAAATTIISGGSVLVSNGGNWAMAGNIISADKVDNATAPAAAAAAELITFDGSGTYTNAATTAGTTGNVIDGYAASTAAWTGTVLPLGNATAAYPLTIPASTAITAAYFDGNGTQAITPTGTYVSNTTEFSQYYHLPVNLPAGIYTVSYPSGLTAGHNALLNSANGSAFALNQNIPNIATATAGTTNPTLLAVGSPTRLYMSSSNSALPITVLSFTGVKTAAGNLLGWTVADAKDFSHFDLQRHTDGSSFASIATLPYVNGTSNYSYTDANATGINYYRLALVDLDGKLQYSGTVAIINNATGFAVGSIYPVPASTILNVVLYAPVTTNVTYTVTDISGKTISKEVHSAMATTTQAINVGYLAKGTYLITVDAGSTKVTHKFIKL